ncbi:cupin domain-containing protein [Agreia sp. Leaf210]|uniref:cupin domain-containing protein n=1 Tax=Agreia sp. Leaf210 TaxID=1735682 RepID=UPI0006F65452|nr:cupin domain-containing protein [Agreia sp. Leaf210]KQM59376.1 cupin [Agreia sp. Leaf210]
MNPSPHEARAERGSGNRPALSRCISIGADEFAADYWGQGPLLSRADSLERDFSDLFSSDAVDELVSERGLRTPFMRMAIEGQVLAKDRFTAPGGFGAEIADQISSDKVLTEFAAGATIVLQGLHRTWPPIIDFTTRLLADLGHPVQVNAYVTPASSRGFDPHYDVHDVFVLQIAGEKRWRIHSPVHPDPLADQPWSQHAKAVADEATNAPVIDEVLQPGDVLYLPRGWIHSAEALGDTSVHLTIGMSAFTRADLVSQVIAKTRADASLRSSLPLGLDLGDPDALAGVLAETLADLVAAIHDDPLTPDAAAASLARRFTNITRPEPVRPLATVAGLAHLDVASVVRWRLGLAGRVEARGDTVSLTAGARTLSLPLVAHTALERLLLGESTPVGALPGLDDEDAIVVCRRLVREGVLVLEA